MAAKIYSLYWDNIDPELVVAQKAVCNALQMPISQHRIDGLDHGEWIDWVMTRMDDVDVFLFLDIDCIPLSKSKVMEGMRLAASGALVGAEGAANHIDPSRSYAGAWYVYINRKVWAQLGRPSAKATPQADVCQVWTDTWSRGKLPVHLIPPLHCVMPAWDLPGRKLAYGIGTTYGEDCFHMFQGRGGDKGPFLEKCRQVTGEK
jgi:hypothetical protein